jgi:hypothetical protein
MMDGTIGRLTRLDIELPKQRPERDSRALVTDPDPNRAVLVVDAHIAITARSNRGSAMPGIASNSLPDRKVGWSTIVSDHEPLLRGEQYLRR